MGMNMSKNRKAFSSSKVQIEIPKKIFDEWKSFFPNLETGDFETFVADLVCHELDYYKGFIPETE